MIITTKNEQSRIAAQMLEKFLQEKNNRVYKNSVFVDLFSTDETAKENFLSLYNALHGTNFKLSETQVEIKTLERTLYMGFRNDVSALINGKLLVLVEHQSTINENMPLRFLEYVAQLYKQLVPLEKRYNRKTLEIPAPEFYVLYNGTEDYPSEKTLKLSDAFIGKKKDKASDTTDKATDESEENEKNNPPPLEILVKVININTVKQSAVLERCKVLSDYSSFIDIVRREKASGDEFFFYNAIQIAKQRDVLSDYLSRKTWEVSGMTFAEYDYDMDIAVQRQEAFEDGREEGREEGITIGEERGAHDKAVETARNFLTLGVGTQEQITQATGLPLAEVQSLAEATVR